MTHLNSGTETKSQIDYILIRRKWRGCLLDTEAFSNLSSLGSDHRVLVATMKLRLRANTKQSRKVRYDWAKLTEDSDLQGRYTLEVRNRFEGLQVECASDQSITSEYKCLVETNKETASKLLPTKKRDKKLLASEDRRVSAARTKLQEASEQNISQNSRETRDALKTAKEELDMNIYSS